MNLCSSICIFWYEICFLCVGCATSILYIAYHFLNFSLLSAEKKGGRMTNFKLRRILSLLGGVAAAVAVLFIFAFPKGQGGDWGGFWLRMIACIPAFTFVSCLILDNNAAMDILSDILAWSCVRMPGLIISFDFDGLKFFIFMKLLFFVIGVVLGIICGILGVIVSAICSVFIYPYALYKNIKRIDD